MYYPFSTFSQSLRSIGLLDFDLPQKILYPQMTDRRTDRQTHRQTDGRTDVECDNSRYFFGERKKLVKSKHCIEMTMCYSVRTHTIVTFTEY